MKETVNVNLKENEVPGDNWATWALLEKAFDPKAPAAINALALEHCARRLGTLHGDNPDALHYTIGERWFVVLSNDGYWGRGKSLVEAATAAVKAGAGRAAKAVAAIIINAKPSVNSYGAVVYDAVGVAVNVGAVGTIGGILNANPKE